MSKTSEAIIAANSCGDYSTYAAYIAQVDEFRVVIRADGTGGRRQRSAEVSGLKRAIEKRHGCTLVYSHTNYSETAGFLSRTEIWYQLIAPTESWEVWEFSNAHQFKPRHGVVGIRSGYASEQAANEDMEKLKTRELSRRAQPEADVCPRWFQVRLAKS